MNLDLTIKLKVFVTTTSSWFRFHFISSHPLFLHCNLHQSDLCEAFPNEECYPVFSLPIQRRKLKWWLCMEGKSSLNQSQCLKFAIGYISIKSTFFHCIYLRIMQLSRMLFLRKNHFQHIKTSSLLKLLEWIMKYQVRERLDCDERRMCSGVMGQLQLHPCLHLYLLLQARPVGSHIPPRSNHQQRSMQM